ncbi:MAG: hypothetical protein IKL18_06250 [Oscillospiraceae bacterium]|nr:hypothetical protein [Oscillospiraceae bacterium]MBR6657751.1 hypothetical protein [Oscillospiraceae bacterium]
MNRNFAKSIDGISLEFAPSEFDYKGVRYNATNDEKIYNVIGYFRFERTEAPFKEGFYYSPFYEVEENVLVEKWREHEIPKEESFSEEEIEKAVAEGVNSIDE